jgi:hypothetical protein
MPHILHIPEREQTLADQLEQTSNAGNEQRATISAHGRQ